MRASAKPEENKRKSDKIVPQADPPEAETSDRFKIIRGLYFAIIPV